MGKLVLFIIAVGCWITYILNGHQEATIPKTPTPVSSPHPSHHKTVYEMSDSEYKTWIAKQDPHDPEVPEKDTTIHYDAMTIASINDMMSGGSSSSSENAILQGNTVFAGTSSDGTGAQGVTSVTTASSSTTPKYSTRMTIPTGYHLVAAHYTAKGKLVKAHLAKNPKSKSRAANISLGIADTTGVSRSADHTQRVLITKQNFPNAKASSSDPTVLLGIGYK